MTKIDLSKRFLNIMLSKDNYKSTSLPMVTTTSEVMFFYYAETTQDGGFILTEICEIFYRDLITSEITTKTAADVFTPAELEKLTNGEVSRGLVGDEVQEAIDAYYDLHEKVVSTGLTGASSDLLRQYNQVFERIIPKGPLRTAYQLIGKELFQFDAEGAGKRGMR